MARINHILLVEDLPADVLLAKLEIESVLNNCEFEVVETEEDFMRSLNHEEPDIIVSDYKMPVFNGLAALKLASERCPFTPFIILTGSMNEDVAVECMKAGATDYVIKEHRKRLGAAVLHALEQKEIQEKNIRAQKALCESEERFRRLTENAEDLIYRYEYFPKCGFTYVSPAATRMTGYTPDEHYADPDLVLKIIHPDDRHVLERYFEKDGVFDTHLTLRWIRKDGNIIWIEQKNVPMYDDDKKLIAIEGIARDVTESKRAEEALRSSEELYHKLVSASPEAISIIGMDGKISYVSPMSLKMFGSNDEHDVLGHSPLDWIAPQDNEKAMKNIANAFRGQYIPNDLYHLYKVDGTEFMGEFNAALLMDSNNKPIGLIIVIRDVTGRIQTEEKNRQLEQQLVQVQKLESLGTLASGIAHDFNNVLGIILAHITAIEKIKLDPEKYSQSIQAVRKATERGASLVKQLLTFARKTDFFFESLFINDIIKEMVKLLDETFPKTIEILTNLKSGLPSMLGDATQLHQVLLNLCVNARDAMPYGGKLIMTTSIEIGEDIVSFYPKASAREYVLVQITDTGVGMDEAIKQRVFEPFFTTKETGKGTGLGLALVYAIVDKHKGFIHLESELGKGTTFNVFLPISEREISVTQMKTIEDVDVPGGTETILFVEDEESLRDKVSEILQLKGYSVLTAKDGEEAVNMFSRERNNIALTITDLGLAKFGGDEVFRRIRTIDKNAKVVIASGFIDPYFRIKLLEAGVKQFIQKPYLPVELMKTIREVINVK